MRRDCIRVRNELKSKKQESQSYERNMNDDDSDDDDEESEEEVDEASLESSISSAISVDEVGGNLDLCVHMSSQDSVNSLDNSVYENDFEKLSIGLQKRAENLIKGNYVFRESEASGASDSHNSYIDSTTEEENDNYVESTNVRTVGRRRSSRDRNVNRQLHRLYKGRAFTAGLVFSKGHFLGDISKMVAGLLGSTYQGNDDAFEADDNSGKYGFGEKNEGTNPFGGIIGDYTIHEQEGDQNIVHSTTLAAGKDGCIVLVFPKPSLIMFLDEYPGLLLSLLGTQVVL